MEVGDYVLIVAKGLLMSASDFGAGVFWSFRG
jgi:hypothetical protein